MKKEKTKKAILSYGKYTFEPSDGCRERFDLYEAGVSAKGTAVKKCLGYGYKLPDAIDKMIKEGLSERTEISTLKDYVDAYKTAVNEVKSIL